MATNPIAWTSDESVRGDHGHAGIPNEPYDEKSPELPPWRADLPRRPGAARLGHPGAQRRNVQDRAVLAPEPRGREALLANLRAHHRRFLPDVRTCRSSYGRAGTPRPTQRRAGDRAERGDEPDKSSAARTASGRTRRARTTRSSASSACWSTGTQPEVLRPQQRRVRRRRGCFMPFSCGAAARAAGLRQHQLLEDRADRIVRRLPELRVRLAADVGRARPDADRRAVQAFLDNYVARAEEARPLPAPAQQPALQRERAGSTSTRSSRRTTAC